MDVNAIASVATELSATKLQQEVGMTVLKKALDISSSNALALIQALPSIPSSANLPDHLGQNVNTTA
ncbi:YjfB family protein [Methylobacillus caricis]|uniref:YjfB family protein n=1 Tax=Methylobacillus caricis TaxID=1971611 RepID=UPI001CFF6912|nr:YjfB family protein [Methylobacillus caricis]MCB5187897.1 YjfB family protein [Methylobacillus caricis]